MKQYIQAGLALSMLAAAACNTDTTGPSANELLLAQESQAIAQGMATASGATHDGWLRRLLDTLRTTDDPEALAFLEQARAYRDSAHQAFLAGDRIAARHYLHLAFRAVLSAVIEIYPNAPARTGNVVDQIVTRIETHLGDREAPRIRRVLQHVKGLRAAADQALANGDGVTALVLNLRSLQILHRLVDHLQDRHDHDGAADREMEGEIS